MKQIDKATKPFHWSKVSAVYTECRLRENSYIIMYPNRLGLGRGLKSWFLCILQQPHSTWDRRIPEFRRAMEEMML